MENDNNFKVDYIATNLDEDTTVVTSKMNVEQLKMRENEIINSAVQKIKSPQYSVVTNEDTNTNALTIDYIDQIATGIHSNLENLRSANQIIVKNVDEDGLMGYAYNCIKSNIPTSYKNVYKTPDNDIDKNKLDEIKSLIEDFNEEIHIKQFIRDIGSAAYLEGNVPVVLRIKGNTNVVDLLPLSIAYPSDYRVNGDIVVEVDVDTLKSKLSKTYKKTKKNKAVYFENIKKEIQNNFGNEVVKAYNDKEKYARLDTKYADCITVNSLGRKFGLSPFFRALKPLVVLNNIESADVSDSKARSKKIIFQKLRKELGTNQNVAGASSKNMALTEQALAHDGLMQALKTNLCAYTSPWFVESLEFISSKSNNDDSSKQMVQYTTKYLQSLGIDFVDTEIGNYAGVNVSITQIIRTINCIKEEIERVINKFYKTLLEVNGYDTSLSPIIKIDGAETLEMSMRLDLAKFAYGTLNASLETTFNLVGLNLDDEKIKRQTENDENLDEVFAPRLTAYTNSGSTQNDTNDNGRPQSNEDKGKQEFDKNYRKDKNK